MGFPGREKFIVTLFSYAQRSSVFEINSLPLFVCSRCGTRCCVCLIRSITATTSSPRSPWPTSIATHSRLKLSTTVRAQIRPDYQQRNPCSSTDPQRSRSDGYVCAWPSRAAAGVLTAGSALPGSKSDRFSYDLLTSLPVVKEYECAGNRSELVLLQSLLSSKSGPCHRGSYGSCTPCDSASSDCSHSADQFGRRPADKSQLPFSGRASKLFSNDILEHFLVQTEVCHQTKEPLIFILQLPQTAQFYHAHPAKLFLPVVKSGFRNAHLSAQFLPPSAGFCLFQRKSDLFFGIAGLFHDGMASLFDERKTGYFSLDWYYFQGRDHPFYLKR